jgi:outer membrane usher protein
MDWVHAGALEGLRPPRIDVDLNGRFLGVAFENELTYDGDGEVPFSRFGSRAIYDRPDWNVRGTVGDLVSNPIGFQSTLDVLGVGVSRLRNSFGGDRIVTASSGRTITLREDARVTLIVNGVTVRTLDLPAGVFDLADLPLTTGANQVQLVVEDAAGGRRVVNFDFFQDFELLEPGDNEFDLQVGIRSTFRESRKYFVEEPAISGFFRRGITSQFTAGANVQATSFAQQLGVEGTIGTSFGLFTLEAAASNIEDVGFGHAFRLQYRYTFSDFQLRNDRRLDLQVEHTSPTFGGVDDLRPFNTTGWRLSGRYSQPVTDTISAGLGVDYTEDRIGRDRYGVRGTLSWQIDDRATLNTFAGFERREGFGFGLNLLVRLGRGSIATAQYDSLNDLGSVTFRHSPERLLDTLAYGAQLTHAPGSLGFNGNAVYRTNRGDLEVAHITAVNTDSDRISSQITSLRYQGAIAFTGGRLAVGRYLFDSFAIVSAHNTLGDAEILIGDRVNNRIEARTDAFGPALVPLGSYSRRNIFYEVPDSPAGYDLGSGSFEVYPWLHTGFELMVGSEFNVTIIGTFLDERGEPVRLLSGVARRVGDEKSPAVPIFTNRSGRLGASGLAPGRWEINAGGFVYSFSIDDGQGTFVDLKQVRPTRRQQENSQ